MTYQIEPSKPVLMKAIRNGIADPLAALVSRFPGTETRFCTIGRATNSLPWIRTIYLRAAETLRERLRRQSRHHRRISIGHQSFVFDVTDFTVRGWYFHRQMFEPATTEFVLSGVKPGQVVIDIGANRGYITILAALQVGPTGRVYSFEPNPEVFADLKQHVELNHLTDRVNIHDIALSDADGQEATLFVSNVASNSGLSSLTPQADLLSSNALSAQNTVRVQTTTLDAWLQRQGLEQPIDLIKVDVEGAESMVLSGAKDTLRNHPPRQWIIETKVDSGVDEWMQSFGYRTKALEQFADTVNLLCTHSVAELSQS